jgi:hypothetical protein
VTPYTLPVGVWSLKVSLSIYYVIYAHCILHKTALTFLSYFSDMKCVLVQIAKVGFVQFVVMKLLDEEECRIMLNAFNCVERKCPDIDVVFHYE